MSGRLPRAIAAAACAAACWHAAAGDVAPARETLAPGDVTQAPFELGGGKPLVKTTIHRGDAPDLVFYISKPTRPAPLVLYIQGSGCSPAIYLKPDGQPASTVFSYASGSQDPRYAVMVVDKPLVPAQPPADAGEANGCPAAFNARFGYDTWLRDLRQAYRYATTLPWVDGRRTLALGLSEGSTMAAGLAGLEPGITDVALVGASGTNQAYDFVVEAYRSGKSDVEIRREVEGIEATYGEIEADPRSAVKFAWGHPYLRWSTFFAASPARSLLQSDARMYFVSGMQDDAVPILSTESMYWQLRAAGKHVTLRRIPDAGHSLRPPTSTDPTQTRAEIDRILDWFDAGGGR